MLFSVITVTRNHLSGLRNTAASLAREDGSLFEWIVIDGASNDGTPEYLKSTKAQWISEPDHGIYGAMNKGLERATGDYLLFLNAGDTLALPRTLDTLAEILKARPVQPDLIYSDAFEDTAEGRVVKTARSHTNINQGLFTHHQAIFYRREIVSALRYDQQYNIAADYKLTAQHLALSKNVMYWPRPVCLFEQGGVSQQQAFKGRMQQALIRRELGMTRPIEEVLIVAKQTLAFTLRCFAPKLYWHLRATSV